MDKTKGYLLPDTAYTEDMVCQLVYYPDKPEYRRALLGSLAYLATWIAWEKESEHKGIDAALSWKIALDLTVECWQMACLEQLQDDVGEILAIMRLGQSCCDEQDVTYGDQYTDRVEDGVGNVPQNIIDAGYASGTSDWDGFDDYKCMIAHVTVNQLDAKLLELNELVNSYGAVAGGVTAVAGIMAVIFGTGGLAIVFGIVAGVGAVSLLYEALMDFPSLANLAAKVVTNHYELACSVYNSDGDEDALSNLNDKIDELFTVVEAVILKNMNLAPTLKALYAGRYDQQDIAEILEAAGYDVLDFECVCDDRIGEHLIKYTWPIVDDWDGWTHKVGDSIVADGIEIYCPTNTYNGGFTRLSMNQLGTDLGLSDLSNRHYRIRKITFNTKALNANSGVPTISMSYSGGSGVLFSFAQVLVWTEYDTELIEEFDDPGYHLTPTGYLQVYPRNGVGWDTRFDDVTIDFDSYIV